jgi:hypothetical protein
MSDDLSHILRAWPYVPEQISVRLVRGDDGRDKIQLRIDLGLLQMEMEGRPDGERPEGLESWLEYYEQQQREHDGQHPDGVPFRLGDEACARLWREGVQYYHRYLSCWHLDLYPQCAADTARNLRLFSFVRAHTTDDRARLQFDQWRPYVTMMHARAVAMPLIEAERVGEALEAIEEGIDGIRDFLEEYQQTHRSEECVELTALEQWRDEILQSKGGLEQAPPQTAVQMLRRKLEAAIAAEQFEEAARLRDEIRRLSEEG